MIYLQNVENWLGGVNRQLAPNLIPPNAMVRLDNGIIDVAGFVRARPGTFPLGGPETAVSPSGLHYFNPPDRPARFLAIWASRLYKSGGGGVWAQIASDATMVNGLHGMVTCRRGDGTEAVAIHSVGRTDEPVPYTHLLVVDPDGAYTQRDDFAPGCAAFFQGRLWAGDVASYPPDTLFWSHIWDAADFSGALVNNVRIDPQAGGRITALVPSRGNIPQIYVFKESAIYLLDIAWQTEGYLPFSTDTLDVEKSSLRPLSYQVGCLAPLSALWIPTGAGGDVYFLGADGVRSLRRADEDVPQGGAGLPLSMAIQDYVDRITWAQARNAVAAVHRDYYYLAVPLDGAVYPTHIFAKHLFASPYEGWSVWDIRARAFAQRSDSEPTVYFQLGKEVSSPESASTGTYVYELTDTGLNLDPGSLPIEFMVETRGFDLGPRWRGRRKYWRWLQILYDAEDTALTIVPLATIDQQDTWYTLPPFTVDYGANRIILPARLPWRFGSNTLQTHKIGLEDIPAGYMLRLRFWTGSPGTFNLRRVEIAAQPVAQEWL